MTTATTTTAQLREEVRMNKAQITDNPLVHELYELPGPIVTAYLNSPWPGPGVDHTGLRIRTLLDGIRGTEATRESLEALGSVLGTLEPGAPPAAAFVGADGQTRMFSLPGAQVEDQAHCAAVPHVLPLLVWRQRHPAYALVMLDRTGAELVVQPAGAAEPVRSTVAGPDDVIERNAPGGTAQSRYQNRAEDSWQHNAGRAAEAVTDALAASGAELLIVGGDVRAEQYFLDRLPTAVRTGVSIKTIPGSRSADGSERHRGERVEALVQEHVNEQCRQLLDRVQDGSGPGGLGVQGPAPTIHALARAQVQVLLLAAPEPGAGNGASVSANTSANASASAGNGAGNSAPEPTTAWFGPQPTDISEHRTGVLVPDGRPEHGPLQEVLARSAVLTDADIRVLPGSWTDGPPRGVGALCRFAVT
jgi:hypothetical protein